MCFWLTGFFIGFRQCYTGSRPPPRGLDSSPPRAPGSWGLLGDVSLTPPHVPSPPLLVYGFVLKVDVPLSIFENPSDSDSDGDMVDLDIFVQKLDAETSGALT